MDIDSEPPCSSEDIINKIEKPELEETLVASPAVIMENNLSGPDIGGSNNAVDHLISESIPSPVVSRISACYKMPFDIFFISK